MEIGLAEALPIHCRGLAGDTIRADGGVSMVALTPVNRKGRFRNKREEITGYGGAPNERAAGPIQIVCAGKVHPRDRGGKDLVRRIVEHIRGLKGQISVADLEDCDVALARRMIAGVMKNAIALNGSFFNTERMVDPNLRKAYL